MSTHLHPGSRGAGSRRPRSAAASWAFSAGLLAIALAGWLGFGAAAGCSPNPNTTSFDESDSGYTTGADAGLDGGDTFAEGGQTFFQNDAGAQGALAVTPANPVLTVTVPGAAGKQSFKAMSGSGAVTAKWSVDDATLGSIDGNGVFTASGKAGGVATVTASAGGATASTTVTVHIAMTDNAGNLSTAVQGQLTAGGGADPAFRWLYPYDKTVFPRGLTAPVLQLDGTAPTGVLVHVTSKNLDYKGFFGASTPPGQVTLGAAAWTLVTASAGASDPVQVDVTKVAGTGVSGPIRESWTIAQGTLKGTVYYDTYDSTVATGGGAVMRIKPGTPAQVLLENCTTCHAVSADGSTLVASANHGNDESFDLRQDAGVKATVPDTTWSFGAVYPDGSLVLQSGGSNIPGMGGLTPSQLWDTKTGTAVAAPGFDGVVVNAVMPMFSPDGKKVAFNDEMVGSGHTLSIMGFDASTKTFSGLTQVVSTTTDNYVGWPAFLPSSTAFLFGNVDASDYATWEMHHGDLSVVDLASKAVVPLDALNGVAGGKVYLPYGDSEAHLNYEPTALPVAVGGYYWTVFTSRREYGNTITDADPWESGPARRKKLWVAAIDQTLAPGQDPSHPAFYLNDQELDAGNMRGFWVLDPCAKNGAGCSTGDQCCTGFCRAGGDGGGSVCVAPPAMGCAGEFEKCVTALDCCASSDGFTCINGFCARPPPH